jgi:uncharacterized protein YkwD
LTTYHVRAGDTVIVDPEPVTPPPPPPPPPPPAPEPFTVSDAAFSAAMVAEVNKRRVSGWTGKLADGTPSTLPPVGPLLADPDLFKAAVASVTDSAQTRTSTHKDWISPNVGTRTHTASGEVIGQDKGYPEATTFFVDAWMKSDGHRAILMNGRYDSAGFAYSRLGDDQVYFAGEFADFSAIPTPPPPVITPVPTTGWGAQPAFMARPTSGTLRFSNQGPLTVNAKAFASQVGSGVISLQFLNCWDITLTGLDFDGDTEPMFFYQCHGKLEIGWCRAQNIVGPHQRDGTHRGNFYQQDSCLWDSMDVHHLKVKGGDTEDVLSHFRSGGKTVGAAKVHDFAFDMTGWKSGSGTGIIAADAGGGPLDVYDGTMLNPGQVGMQLIDGKGHRVHGLTIYSAKGQVVNPNVGMSSYSGSPTADVFSNRVRWYRNDGSENPYWWGAGSINAHTSPGDPLANDWHATIDPKVLEVVL